MFKLETPGFCTNMTCDFYYYYCYFYYRVLPKTESSNTRSFRPPVAVFIKPMLSPHMFPFLIFNQVGKLNSNPCLSSPLNNFPTAVTSWRCAVVSVKISNLVLVIAPFFVFRFTGDEKMGLKPDIAWQLNKSIMQGLG